MAIKGIKAVVYVVQEGKIQNLCVHMELQEVYTM